MLFFVAQSVSSESSPENPPSHVHPRLLFTKDELPQIKKNLTHSENAAAYAESEKLLSEYFGKDISFTPIKKRTFTWSGKIIASVEASAFKYAITGKKKYADWAFKTFVNCCSTIDLTGIYDDYRPYGQMIFTAAEIYDWCYDALSKSEKTKLYEASLTFIKKLQIGYPPVKGKTVTGHSAEGQLLRAYLAAGISMYDEHKDLWNMSSSRFYEEFIPPRKFFYDSLSPNFQGTGYGPYRSMFDLWSAIMICAMKNKDPYDGKLSLWSKYFIYIVRPDGMSWHIGDDHAIEKMNFNFARYGANAFLQSVISKDPYIKFFAKEKLGNFKSFKYNDNGENDDVITPVQFLILNDVNLLPKDYRELSPSYYCPYPLGEYLAASSWEEKDNPAIHLKIGEYAQANHEHQDAGSFEIFCNGLLASTGGFYLSGGGGNGYRSGHTQKYYHSSVSKNTLLLQSDPASYESYGLQLALPEAKSFGQILSDAKYHRGKVTAHFDSLHDKKGLVFLAGDISNAYEAAGFVHRSMLAFFTGDKKNPLIFFVYDQIDSGKKGIFLLHSLKEPEILERRVLIKNKNDDIGLANTVLFPENPKFTKIGGKGHEWEVAGINYSQGSEKAVNAKSESGWGRIEISDSSQKTGRQILFNVMEVFTDGKKEDLSREVLSVKTDKFDFAVIKGLAVGFYRGGDELKSSDFTVSLPEFAEKRIILCNLPAGKWTVNSKTYTVTDENKILIGE